MNDCIQSIVVCFTDDGAVESMTYGDSETLAVVELKVSNCPGFLSERIAMLKMLRQGGLLLDKDNRVLGMKLFDHRCHVYLNREENRSLNNFFKEKESAKRIRTSSKTAKRNPKPRCKGDSRKDGGKDLSGVLRSELHDKDKENKT
jgi:hypothetical protein